MQNRGSIFARIRQETKELPPDGVRGLLEAAEKESTTGRNAKKIHEWTIEALKDVLAKKMEGVEKHEDLERIAGNLRTSERNLEPMLTNGRDWYLRFPTGSISKEQLRDAFGRIVIAKDNETVPLSGERPEPSAPLYMTPVKETSTLKGFTPNATMFDQGQLKHERVSTLLLDAERTPEWNMIIHAARVMERSAIGNPAVSPSNTTALNSPAVRESNLIGKSTMMTVLVELGGDKFLKAAGNIVDRVPVALRSGDPRACWLAILRDWQRHKLTLDEHVTIQPAASLAEEAERMYAYLITLGNQQSSPRISKLANEVISIDEMVDLARTSYADNPRPIENAEVARLFPHYDPAIFTSPDIVFAKAGNKIVYLLPGTPLVTFSEALDGDLYSAAINDRLFKKQCAAVLHPGTDTRSFNANEWSCGEMLTEKNLAQKKLESKATFTKFEWMSGTKQVLSMLSLQENQRRSTERMLSGTWKFTKGNLTHTIPGAAGEAGLEVDYDRDDSPEFEVRDDMAKSASFALHPAASTDLWRGLSVVWFNMIHNIRKSPGMQTNIPAEDLDRQLAEFSRMEIAQRLTHDIPGLSEKLAALKNELPGKPLNVSALHHSVISLSRSFTRVPPRSLSEAMSRVHILAALVREVLQLSRSEGNQNTPAGEDSMLNLEQDVARKLFAERPRIASLLRKDPELTSDFMELFEVLNIDSPELTFLNVHTLREGKKMRFVCKREDVPDHPIFRRMIDTDEEVTLDLLVAWDEAFDTTIEEERGKWTSGTLPSIEELEAELLSMNVLEGRLLPPPLDDTSPTDNADEDMETQNASETGSADQDKPIPRLKAVRNALLRLGIKAEFTLDERTSLPSSHQYASAERGHYVVVTIPDANLQILVSDDRGKGTRVIYNTLNPQHLTTIDIGKLDEEIGRISLRYADAGQYTSIVASTIEQRLKDPSPVYPVQSTYPSPLDTFPNETALAALKRDFSIAATASGKAIHDLKVGDFGGIKSEETVWSFGGAACGQAYLDRLSREFGLHATALNREPVMTSLSEADSSSLRQSDFRKTVLQMILWELSPEYRSEQTKRAETADRHGRVHSMPTRRRRNRPSDEDESESAMSDTEPS